ncbi:hypothetical protein Tco_0479127 [Tanacetum coccineum]
MTGNKSQEIRLAKRGITTTSPTPPWCGCGGCGGHSRLGRRHSGGRQERHPPPPHLPQVMFTEAQDGTPEGLRRHSPTPHGAAVVAVPSSDRHHDGGGSVVAVGDGLVAWRGCRRLCHGGGGGTRLVEMEVMVASNEDDSKGSGGGVVMMGIEEVLMKIAAVGGGEAKIEVVFGVGCDGLIDR